MQKKKYNILFGIFSFVLGQMSLHFLFTYLSYSLIFALLFPDTYFFVTVASSILPFPATISSGEGTTMEL